MQSNAAPRRRAVYAFTSDLRLSDHAGLAAAARRGAVVPVAIIDPARAERLRASPRRAAYFCSALAALASDLSACGVRLVVRRGAAGPLLREIAAAAGANAVYWSSAYDAPGLRADRDLQSFLEEAGLRATPIHDAPVMPPDESAALHREGGGYRAFVPYHARWREFAVPEYADPISFDDAAVSGETLPEPAEFGSREPCPESVSEAAAATALARFLDLPVLAYAAARNVPAIDGTARLSAALGWGTLAARTVVRAVHARARDPFLLAEERAGLRAFLRAFAQRDFFLQLAWFSEDLGDAPLQPKMRRFRFAADHPHLPAWKAGRTGYPFVDAGIRQLHATGWMHPRVRAVAASFLCFDLGVDWRVGRDEWDRWLTEDTPALATGNWQWTAAVGADLAAYPRIYNPLAAARRYDPAAGYIRRWLPELALVTDDAIFDPLGRRASAQLGLDLFGPPQYPAPVLDHETAARAFLARYRRDVGSEPAPGPPAERP